MSDRIAVMNRGRVEQLGHAGGALRAAARPGSSPTSSARRTSCAGRSSRSTASAALVRLGDRRELPGRPMRPAAARRGRRAQRPAGGDRAATRRTTRPGGTRSAPPSSRSPTSGGTSSTIVRTAGRSVDHRARAEDRGAAPGRRRRSMSAGRRPTRSSSAGRPATGHAGGGPSMNDRHDGSSIDLERALVRLMVERRISRRAAARGDRQARRRPRPWRRSSPPARGGGVRRRPSARRRRPRPRPRRASSAPGRERRSRRRSPRPRASCSSTTGTTTSARTTIAEFEDKYGIKVIYDFFSNTTTMIAKIGATGRAAATTSPSRPRSRSRASSSTGVVQPLDLSLIPNVVNLGAEWADPGYDPGNAHSMPYMWWTTGFGCDRRQDPGRARPAGRRSGTRATGKHISMLDDSARPSPSPLFRLGWTRTRPTTPSSTRPSPCSRSRSRSSAPTRPTTSA